MVKTGGRAHARTKQRCSEEDCPNVAKFRARRKTAAGEWDELEVYACHLHSGTLGARVVAAREEAELPVDGIQIVPA